MHTCNSTSHSKLSYPEGTVDHVVLLRLCCICDGCVCYVCGVCMSNEKRQVQIFNITQLLNGMHIGILNYTVLKLTGA